MTRNPMEIDEFLSAFELKILEHYNRYVNMAKNSVCIVKKQKVSLLDYEAFNINFSALKEAISLIKMDIKILDIRRGNLIGNMRMSEGKITGVTAFRLAKAHIIHIHRKCNACIQKCHSHLNFTIAVRIGLDYIHKKYTELPASIRNELTYSLRYRHVNQETLGLVFDALKEVEIVGL